MHWGSYRLVPLGLTCLPIVTLGYIRETCGLEIRIRHKRDKIGVKDIPGREW
jgi:hypothetical protein